MKTPVPGRGRMVEKNAAAPSVARIATLVIFDNGCGFDVAAVPRGMGSR